jgi:hypothetical protein
MREAWSGRPERLLEDDVREAHAGLLALLRAGDLRVVDLGTIAALHYTRSSLGLARAGDLPLAVSIFGRLVDDHPRIVPRDMIPVVLGRRGDLLLDEVAPSLLLQAAERLVGYAQQVRDSYGNEQAESFLRAAAARLDADDPQRPIALNNLGALLLLREDSEERKTDPDELLALARGIVPHCRGHAQETDLLTGAAVLLQAAASTLDDAEIRREGVALSQSAVAAAVDGMGRARALLILGTDLLRVWADEPHDAQLLKDAEAALGEAVSLLPVGSLLYRVALFRLVAVLRHLRQQSVSPGSTLDGTDVEDVLHRLRECLAAPQVTGPAVAPAPGVLVTRGVGDDDRDVENVLYDAWIVGGDLEHLTVLIRRLRQGPEGRPASPAGRPDRDRTDLLIRALGERAFATRRVEHVKEAVAGTAAVCGPPDSWATVDRLDAANQWARLLRLEWELTGNTAALHQAVRAQERIVMLDDATPAPRSMYRHNLGSLYLRLARATDDRTLAERGLAILTATAESCSTTDPGRAMYFHNLSNALLTQYQSGHDRADLLAAVDASRTSVQATPPDDPDHLLHVSHLAGLLTVAGVEVFDVDVLRQALAALRVALAGTSDSDTGRRVVALLNLAQGLVALGEAESDEVLVEEGRRAAAAASCLDEAPVQYRVGAKRVHARLRAESGDLEGAAGVYADGVSLMIELPRWVSDRRERESAFRWLGDLARDAGAVTARCHDGEVALSVLDAGRAVLLGRGTDYRRQVADLARLDPAVARRLDEIRQSLEVLG